MAIATDMDVNALKGLGLSDADIASLAAWSPSDFKGIGNIGPVAGAGVYYGESKTFTAPLSNKGNATSTLNRDNIYAVTPDSTVTVVDNTTGKVVYSGIGYDAAAKANEVAQGLSDTGGNKATWDIVVDTPGMEAYGAGSGPVSVAHEKVNLSATQIGLQVLSVAAQIGVAAATAGASLPAQMAAAGATSAAFTIAQGGSLGDAVKAGVMAAVPAAGAKYLGPVINEGLNTASAMVGKAIGAGLSTTTAALLTGQDLGDSIKSGVISGVTTALAPEVKDLFKGAENAVGTGGGGGGGGGGDIVVTAGGGTAGIGGFSSPTSNTPRPSNTNAQGDITVTAGSLPGVGIGSLPSSTGSYTNVNIPNEIADLANLPDDTSEIIVNANDYIAGIGGASVPVGTNANVDIDTDTDIAQDEIIVEGGEETAGIGGPDIPVNTSADVNADTDISQDEIIVEGGEETAGIGGGPLSTNMTDIGDLINSDDFQQEIAEEEADKDDKSILDIAQDAAKVVGAVAAVAGAVTAGGGGGGGGGGGDNGPGITLNPIVLTPTIPGTGGTGGISGVGRYPYTPTTYGIAGGDQETEYEFFTRSRANPVTTPTVPPAAPGRKDGGEIDDDMVKHLVEYRKGGGHQGPGKVTGAGSGQEDLIPAWLSDGEYVWSAQDVADLGDGSTDEGVRRLDKMRQMVRRQAGRKDVKKIAKPQKGIDTMLKAVGGQA